jgi:hypothetical protein
VRVVVELLILDHFSRLERRLNIKSETPLTRLILLEAGFARRFLILAYMLISQWDLS